MARSLACRAPHHAISGMTLENIMKVEVNKKQRDQLRAALTAAIDDAQFQLDSPENWEGCTDSYRAHMETQVLYWTQLVITVEGWK